MTTWAELLADIRTDLQDAGQTPRWSDDLLFMYAKDAIRDYSEWFPRRVDRTALTLSGSSYPLPADFVSDIFVESPVNTFLEKRQERPGTKYSTLNTRPYYYFIDGGNLYLNGSPRDDVLLTYYATHPVPSAKDDSAFLITVPDSDIELLRLYVKAQVHSQMRGKTSRLDRFEPGSGRRDDNPLLPEYNSLMQEYLSKISERVTGGSIRLYRPGRVR
jgi:hypothetical protein